MLDQNRVSTVSTAIFRFASASSRKRLMLNAAIRTPRSLCFALPESAAPPCYVQSPQKCWTLASMNLLSLSFLAKDLALEKSRLATSKQLA